MAGRVHSLRMLPLVVAVALATAACGQNDTGDETDAGTQTRTPATSSPTGGESPTETDDANGGGNDDGNGSGGDGGNNAAGATRTITGDYGRFVVSCQGDNARGERARANTAGGWRLVEYERGPDDDDVDAQFRRARLEVDVNVDCQGGRAVVDIERDRDDRDDTSDNDNDG